MLLGKLPGGSFAPMSSSPKTPPSAYTPVDSRPLDTLLTTVKTLAEKYSTTVPRTATPVESAEEMQEITVTGKKIPWYAWALAGGVGFIVLNKLLGGR